MAIAKNYKSIVLDIVQAENGTSTKTKRISEDAFISAIEELYNA